MYRCITHEIVSQFQPLELSVASICVVKECKGIKLEKKKYSQRRHWVQDGLSRQANHEVPA